MFLLVLLCCCFSTACAGLIKECRVVGAEELIDEEGCDLSIVRVNRCSGQCLSFSFPNPNTRKNTVHAKCCRMVDSEWVSHESLHAHKDGMFT
ncbi:hypothetical protein WR25_24365 [Diploscapter pachys]|uniref:DAN domain-containing protein n=1 Tax=Diploscapter pachys TaxID=2018661 RepID=A0A2A2LS04_9BILA|nr:hypothetical protein WR25_24365 [Diploscapter pachys]